MLGKFHLDLLSDESHSVLLRFFFSIISTVYITLVGWKGVYQCVQIAFSHLLSDSNNSRGKLFHLCTTLLCSKWMAHHMVLSLAF